MSKSMLLAALAAALLLLLFAPDAKAGTYIVRQCQHPAPTNETHEALAQSSPPVGPYSVRADANICASAAADYAIGISPTADALNGQFGLVRFKAPAGTKFTGVNLDARLRSEQGHRARLSMANAAGVEKVRFATGDAGPADFTHYSWPPSPNAGYEQFTAALICDNAPYDCPISNNGDKSSADIRNIRFDVTDSVAPTATVSGPLVGGGWIRGTQTVTYDARDVGGGIRFAPLGVNGVVVASAQLQTCDLISGTAEARVLAPCPPKVIGDASLDTDSALFVDGDNSLIFCGADFGSPANVTCTRKTIQVDNTPPRLSFEDQESASDPELISAGVGDETSGLDEQTASIEFRAVGATEWQPLATQVVDGQMHARVDSVHADPGAYEFRAAIDDIAGNHTTSTSRADGRPMVLTFPLKEPVALGASLDGARSQLVPFRAPGEVAGRLVDAGGDPIAGAEVTVTETFAEGSLVNERVRTASTDAHGRYTSSLPGGPSREVAVSFEGSKRYSPASATGLDFQVRADATLQTSKRRVKAGDAVAFLGRVKRYYAQIPPGGKLVEVQVKSGDDWTTVHQATATDERGKVVLRHRFRRFYTQPVTFTFRLKVTAEANWPYVGGATSHKRKVTVVPR